MLLLIEDNDDDATLMREMLAGESGDGVRLQWTARLADGLAVLEGGEVELVLLDLGLPDSQGLESFKRVRAAAPDLPVVVVSGLEDKEQARQAVQQGAQDYLVKGEFNGHVLARAIDYAIDRHRLREALDRAREEARQARELRFLESLSRPSGSSVTAALYGVQPISVSAPERFQAMVEGYGRLLELALEEQVFKVEHDIGERCRAMAEELGFLHAAPRDVIAIHTAALKQVIRGQAAARAQGLMDEGRFMVLKLMGNLAAYYRAYAGVKRDS